MAREPFQTIEIDLNETNKSFMVLCLVFVSLTSLKHP